MICLFLDIETRELRIVEPTKVHMDLMQFAEEHPRAVYIARPRPEGNYILDLRGE